MKSYEQLRIFSWCRLKLLKFFISVGSSFSSCVHGFGLQRFVLLRPSWCDRTGHEIEVQTAAMTCAPLPPELRYQAVFREALASKKQGGYSLKKELYTPIWADHLRGTTAKFTRNKKNKKTKNKKSKTNLLQKLHFCYM